MVLTHEHLLKRMLLSKHQAEKIIPFYVNIIWSYNTLHKNLTISVMRYFFLSFPQIKLVEKYDLTSVKGMAALYYDVLISTELTVGKLCPSHCMSTEDAKSGSLG